MKFHDEDFESDDLVLELDDSDLDMDTVVDSTDFDLTEEPLEQVLLPGSEIVLEQDDGESDEKSWEKDGEHTMFLPYMRQKIQEIPRHRGTTIGCERAIAYLRRLDREISRAIHSDESNVIDEEEAERLREQLFSDIEVLEDALENLTEKKKKTKAATASVKIDSRIFCRIARDGEPQYYIKTATDEGESIMQMERVEPEPKNVQAYLEWESGTLKKEAFHSKMMLMVDPFLNEVSSMIIRAHTTYGKDIEEVYNTLAKKYDFTQRDHVALHGLLREKGLLLDKDFSRLDEDIMTGESGISSKIYPA